MKTPRIFKLSLVPTCIEEKKYKRNLAQLAELLYGFACQLEFKKSSPLDRNSTLKT